MKSLWAKFLGNSALPSFLKEYSSPVLLQGTATSTLGEMNLHPPAPGEPEWLW